MSKQDFVRLMDQIASEIAGDALDDALEAKLNQKFAAGSETFGALSRLCAEGEREGWLMAREAGGIRYGRAIKPGEITGNFSVDVVRMKDVRGPHHVHTTGEVGAIIPLAGAPQFDGKDEGWYVYGPGSAHHPTVAGGDAYVLYLLPDGAIEFTGK
ncbi:conserved hypothetical protein [Rhodobacteraceae bacterium KLH11]|nr:conserved hypothetical protein [Rhodobacteraceae bacterium KLH11]